MVTLWGGLPWHLTWPFHPLAKQLEWARLPPETQWRPLKQRQFYGQLKQMIHLEPDCPTALSFQASEFLAIGKEEMRSEINTVGSLYVCVL